MQQQNSGMSCQLGSWALAAGAGLLVFILLLVIGDWGWIGSIFMGAVAFIVLGLLFNWLFCRDLPAARGPGNIAPTQSASSGSGATTKVAAAAPAAVKEAPKPAAEPAAEALAPAPAAPDPKPTATAAADKATAAQEPRVRPSTPLKGQAELAQRKGDWKYEGGGSQAAKAPPAKSAPAKSAATEDATPDYDGDGKLEGTGEGTKPKTLTQAREGGPDNLKEIKGVGPKLEKLLHSMGFFHFDQIANWTPDEEAWVNANLAGFKGRVSRDEWVKQAKILAAGGDTEFSKRVDKGDVY